MASPIFLDANIPIYAAGRPHPLKIPCSQILLHAAHYPDAFTTDVEVIQELLHHYRRHWPIGRDAVQNFLLVMAGRMVSIEPADWLTSTRDSRRATYFTSPCFSAWRSPPLPVRMPTMTRFPR